MCLVRRAEVEECVEQVSARPYAIGGDRAIRKDGEKNIHHGVGERSAVVWEGRRAAAIAEKISGRRALATRVAL